MGYDTHYWLSKGEKRYINFVLTEFLTNGNFACQFAISNLEYYCINPCGIEGSQNQMDQHFNHFTQKNSILFGENLGNKIAVTLSRQIVNWQKQTIEKTCQSLASLEKCCSDFS